MYQCTPVAFVMSNIFEGLSRVIFNFERGEQGNILSHQFLQMLLGSRNIFCHLGSLNPPHPSRTWP